MNSLNLRKSVSGYYIRKMVSRIKKNRLDLVSCFLKKSCCSDDTQYLVRVDDFPHRKISFEKFKEFHSIMKKMDMKYLLAVSPELMKEDEKDYLEQLSRDGVEIGMHGFAHEKNEVLIEAGELNQKIENCLKIFGDINITPEIFIPPHNTVNEKGLRGLSRYFKVVTGGEETIKFLGYRWGVVKIEDIIYIPSYPPLYEKAQNICDYITAKKLNEKKLLPLPLTLHWSWETEDEFSGLIRLLEIIKGRIFSWKEIYGNS